MPTNKNAQIRYQALDKCLGNWGRRYYIEDLVKACNEALYIYNGNTNKGEGVKKRQVQEDLKFIESEEGYRMIIDAIQEGHKKYYRYHKRNASIKEQPINQEEINLIHDALTLLKRFEGVPQFEVSKDLLSQGIKAVDLFTENAAVFPSKGEMRKLVQGGGVSLNKEKLAVFDEVINAENLLDSKYLLVQKGKKNYYLIIAK